MIVGGGNSAIEAALELYRHNVDVTIIHRKENFKPTAKYWLIPDITNRIKEGKIKAQFNTEIVEITNDEVKLVDVKTKSKSSFNADFAYLLVGYLPDISFLKRSSVKLEPKTFRASIDKTTFETDTKGLYLCGTVMAGIQTESIFIENGREHAKVIAKHICDTAT